MPIRIYTRKRDFSSTPEPKGPAGGKRAKGDRHRKSLPHFVIQKHDATRLHYDLRLELGGTLKSWAVPKGMPYQHAEKHLAVAVEDHPLEYAGFEGVIPKGQYGGGTVMVWDNGTYEVPGGQPAKDLAAGKLHFILHGQKLEGEWTLVRRDAENWLLIKSGESVRPVSQKKENASALTGRTMAGIAHEPQRQPARIEFVPPMLATLASEPPRGDWRYELKFDGYRALALKNGRSVRLLSRNAKELQFPEIAQAIAGLPNESLALDGEIVALDAQGRPSFQQLQAREMHKGRPPLYFYIFDLLAEGGQDWTKKPLQQRRTRLQELLQGVSDPLRFSAEIRGNPRKLLEEVRHRGLEGIIGKEAHSIYESGRRSRQWIKLKCVHEQEFVIGGYTPPAGTRLHFGALLVGYYRGNALQFAGKIGTGFTGKTLAMLYGKLRSLQRDESPFQTVPRTMRKANWVAPELVCQIRFSEWTRDGKLRQGAFLGLRKDKRARDVVREHAASL